ncbi:hypothetical protein [Paraburkholderia fungorum]|uniref:hypothetical protein n=1 Tax=Paraburkholderia fungorum TaxID=134537 RepID=UPI002097E1A5|nr:hypothetical protein [Paraburkholderia fungorum]
MQLLLYTDADSVYINAGLQPARFQFRCSFPGIAAGSFHGTAPLDNGKYFSFFACPRSSAVIPRGAQALI